jgi:hypothetical protein
MQISFPPYNTHARPLILVDFITPIIFGERYRSNEELLDEIIFSEQILNICPYKPQSPVTLNFILEGNLGYLINLLKCCYVKYKTCHITLRALRNLIC